jgi:DNA-binding LacI/PurR family transcriptional regulator
MAATDLNPDQKFRGRATIRDIADLAGVSIATVSRVLNDRPDVAPGTRETVMQVVREHGFSTNRGARALSSGRSGFIGVKTCASSSVRRCTSTTARSGCSSG